MPAPPLPAATSTLTSAVLAATSGTTRTRRMVTSGCAARVSAPTIPFQLPWVWSETLCALGPTSTTVRLSTRIVSRCRPGERRPTSNRWAVVRLRSEPTCRSSSHTVDSQWTRSRDSTTSRPAQSAGTSTSRWNQAAPRK